MKFQQRFCFIITLFIVAYKYTLAQTFADNDLWHRLAVGRIFYQLGGVLKHDIFSYVTTKPVWVDHEWGSGVIFYYLSLYFGDWGLLGLKFLALSAVMWLIYAANALITQDDEDYRIGFYVVALMAVVLGFGTTVRCLIFTYLFFTLWIYVLERVRRGQNKIIWIFPVTMLVWVNVHAGFMAGLGLLFLYAMGEFINRKNPAKYLGIIALCLPVTFINPYGIVEFWKYIISAVTMERPSVIEWMPLNLFGDIQELLAFKILLIITIVGYLYKYLSKDKKTDYVAVLVLAVTLWLSLNHLRHQVFFAIAAAIFSQHQYFYEAVKDFSRKITSKFLKHNETNEKEEEYKEDNFVIAKSVFLDVILVAFCAYYIFVVPMGVNAKEPQCPVRAVEFIKSNKLEGNLLTTFNWGSYALWKLYPQCLVFEDGRYEEVYYDDTNADMDNFVLNNKNWHGIFKKYHHDIILVNSNLAVLGKIKALKNWKIIYQDDCSTILVPTSVKRKRWILPDKAVTYDKNKYANTINF